MHIRMTTTAAGPDGVWHASKEYFLPDTIGKPWCLGGFAECLDDTFKPKAKLTRKEVKQALADAEIEAAEDAALVVFDEQHSQQDA